MASKATLSRVMKKAAAYRKKGHSNEKALEMAWDDEGGRKTAPRKTKAKPAAKRRKKTVSKTTSVTPKRKTRKATPKKRSTQRISLLEKILS